ncbi:MAG TPA: hypothetical protein VFU05_13305 [Cyclobacteriaceae bacterium]|nr:hypothetical protein [Cyclobacteriaceae bacterium]
MSDSLFFVNPVFQGWLIALVTIPLFSFLFWKELRRKHKFLTFRIVALVLILISVLGLLFKPGYVKSINSTGFVLLTPGYEEKQVDSLLMMQPGLGALHLPETKGYRGSRALTSYQNLAELDNEILFIMGEGLPPFALELMDVKKFQFIASQKPNGIIQLNFQEVSRANQFNNINGLVNSPAEAILTLFGPGGKEDSIIVKKIGIAPFSLKFKPKQPGLDQYSLQYRDAYGIQSGQIPVVAEEEQKLSILFLQKFPSFEVRQLKNFLAENGHRLALRYQVSKNNYRVEFANVSSIRTSPLTSSVLQQFDLVIVDSDGLESLSTSEKNILEESIHDGLGLMILSNKAAENDKLRERFLPIEMKRTLKDTAYINFSTKPYTLPVLPLQLIESSSVYPVTRKRDRILSAYCYNGFGKSSIQLLQETYRIALEGNLDDYASIWSPLVEKTAKKKDEQVRIKLNNSFPSYEDEPLTVEIITTDESVSARNDMETIPLMEHVTIDNLWSGKIWAGKPGWHEFVADSARLNYFVSDPSEWKTLRISNQLKLNELASLNRAETSQPDIFYQRKPISVSIFYVLFLAAAGFLWLAPKI